MRILIAVVVIVAVLGFVGWIQFSSPNGDPTLRMDTNKMKEDTSAIVDKSKELTHQAADQVGGANDDVDATFDRGPLETQRP